MPTNHEQDDSDNNPHKTVENTTNRESQTIPSNAAHDKVRNSSRATAKSKKKENTVIEIVSMPAADNTEQVRANNIARWSVWVNLTLSVFTIILAMIAFGQYKSSQSAAEIAQKTFLETKKHDSLSLAETKQEFELENRAYLEVTNFYKLRIYPKKITFEYQYTNISIQPAKMTSEYLVVSVGPSNDPFYMDTFKMRIANAREIKDPIYISKEYRKKTTYKANLDLTTNLIKGIKRSDKSIYFYGRVFYTNVMSKKKFIYDFIVTMDGTEGGWSYLYEDNRPDN